jgi:hypothetical protein
MSKGTTREHLNREQARRVKREAKIARRREARLERNGKTAKPRSRRQGISRRRYAPRSDDVRVLARLYVAYRDCGPRVRYSTGAGRQAVYCRQYTGPPISPGARRVTVSEPMKHKSLSVPQRGKRPPVRPVRQGKQSTRDPITPRRQGVTKLRDDLDRVDDRFWLREL